MRRLLPLLLGLIALLSIAGAAHAQAPSVSQAGPIVPGHIVCWTGSAFPQQIYDCGPGGGALGIGQTSIIGGQNGSILYDNNNTLAALTQAQFGSLFCINTNGIVIPVSGGGCTPPGGSVPGGLVSGPINSTTDDIVTFNGITGSVIKDSGVAIANVVQGPGGPVSAGDLVTFNGTTGKSVQDSGVTTASLTPSLTNIAALRVATNHTLPNSTVWVQGFSSPVDGGEGIFTYISTDVTSSDNGGSIIVDTSSRRWYRNTAGDPLNASWFGCNSTTPDCTSAFLNAFNTLITSAKGGGQINFGKGTRTFLSPVTLTYPNGSFSLNIAGEGAEATILNWPNTAGITVAASSAAHSFHMRDLSFTTGTIASVTGLTLSNGVQGGAIEQSDITRVTFRGFDGAALTDSWNLALSVQGMSFINFNGLLFYGSSAANTNGINLSGVPSGSFKYGIVYNLASCGFFNLATGLVYNTWVQGVSVTQSNFTNDVTGILVPLGALNGAQLAVSGSQFQVTGNDIVLLSQFGGLLLTNNLFFVATNSAGLDLNAPGSAQTVITGNIFSGNPNSTATTAITVLATNSGVITGNQFLGLTNGTNLSGSPNNWNVSQNIYTTVTNQVINPGNNQVGVATK